MEIPLLELFTGCILQIISLQELFTKIHLHCMYRGVNHMVDTVQCFFLTF